MLQAVVWPAGCRCFWVRKDHPTGFWRIFVTYVWLMFPAFGLLVPGVVRSSDGKPKLVPESGGERELLGALPEHGKFTPGRAAMGQKMALKVAEADKMLKDFGEGGRLEGRGGGLFCAPWEPEAGAGTREFGDGVGGYKGGVRGMIPIPRSGRR